MKTFKLIIKKTKRLSVYLNDVLLEPRLEGENEVCFEADLEESNLHRLTIVHFEKDREIHPLEGKSFFSSLANSFSEGYVHHFVRIDMSFYIKTNALCDVDCVCQEARFGIYDYHFSDMVVTNAKGLKIVSEDKQWYPSRLDERLSYSIGVGKWLVGLLLLLCFDCFWIAEILHHDELQEIYTNLLSPIHLFLTIPIITIVVLTFCVMDLGAYSKMRAAQRASSRQAKEFR